MEQTLKKPALESEHGTPEAPDRPLVPDQQDFESTVTVEELSGGDNAESDGEDSDEDSGEAAFESILDEMEDLLNEKRDGTEFVVTVDGETQKEIQRTLQAENGPILFMSKYLLGEIKPVPLAQILAALGFPLLVDVADSHPEARLAIMVQIAMKHFLTKRHRLDYPRTLDELAVLIKKSSNIIVLTGAGISTSLGIPDFRSDDGLYAQLRGIGLADPQDVFDIDLFRQDPSIFYSVAKKILPEETKFTPTHQFIRLLQDHNKLLRNYTQNIDNLEEAAGIDHEKLVQCHGSFGVAYCFSCFRKVDGTSLYDDIRAGIVPRCEKCTKKAKQLEAEEHELPDSFGVFKPEITFFGESLPERFDEMLLKRGDARKCDLLICIGTSLKVQPVSSIVRIVDRDVPQIYISKTPCQKETFDMTLLGPCDDVIELLCAKLGWPLEHEMARRSKTMAEDEYPRGKVVAEDGNFTFVESN